MSVTIFNPLRISNISVCAGIISGTGFIPVSCRSLNGQSSFTFSIPNNTNGFAIFDSFGRVVSNSMSFNAASCFTLQSNGSDITIAPSASCQNPANLPTCKDCPNIRSRYDVIKHVIKYEKKIKHKKQKKVKCKCRNFEKCKCKNKNVVITKPPPVDRLSGRARYH